MWHIARPSSERRVALVVVIVFLVAGSAWVLFSDLLLYSFIHDRAVIARFETAKGWGFVSLSAALLYLVTLRSTAKLVKTTRTTRAVLESIGDGVLLLGSDRTIAYANPASIQMLRAANLDELRGMGAPEFSRRFHVSYPDGRVVPPLEFVSQRAFDEGGPIRYKAVLYPPGGPEVVISCTAAGVRSDVEKPAEVVVSVMHDITTTEHLERMRDELFTVAAHAIKTPVAVIKSAAQVLSAEGPSYADQATAMIERQCSRLERLMGNLLVLSRIRSGTLRLYPAEVELGPVVEEVAGDVVRLSPTHPIHVQLDGPACAHADRERIMLAVRNAIHGAIHKSRPDGPIAVRLRCCGTDAEIDVSYERSPWSDEAEGVHQGSTDFDDLGVGRHVTAMIMEAHGGTLTEQADEAVTTIVIRLPVLSKAMCDERAA